MKYAIIALVLSTHAYAYDFYDDHRHWESQINWCTDQVCEEYRPLIRTAILEWSTALGQTLVFNELPNSDKAANLQFFSYTDENATFIAETLHHTENGVIKLAAVAIYKRRAIFKKPNMAIFLHEVGHVLGLQHCKNEDAAMYASPTWTTLSKDDTDGICELYGLSPYEPDLPVTVTHYRGRIYSFEALYSDAYFTQGDHSIFKNGIRPMYGRYPFKIVLHYRGYTKSLEIIKEKPSGHRRR